MLIPPNLEYHSWIRQLRQIPNPRLRLFCFPYAGGGASLFRLWSEYLPEEVEVCPVQLPGRESRVKEPIYDELLPLVEKLSDVLLPGFNLPFVFFGYSLGALIAFELARLIRKKFNIVPNHIIVAASPAPHLLEKNFPVHELSSGEFIEFLRKMEGTPEEVFNDPGLLEFFLPLLRADFRVYETYLYYPDLPLACPISAYGGLGDDSVTEDELQSWEVHTSTNFIRRMFPGNHYFLRDHANLLFRAILEDLSKLIQ